MPSRERTGSRVVGHRGTPVAVCRRAGGQFSGRQIRAIRQFQAGLLRSVPGAGPLGATALMSELPESGRPDGREMTVLVDVPS